MQDTGAPQLFEAKGNEFLHSFALGAPGRDELDACNSLLRNAAVYSTSHGRRHHQGQEGGRTPRNFGPRKTIRGTHIWENL